MSLFQLFVGQRREEDAAAQEKEVALNQKRLGLDKDNEAEAEARAQAAKLAASLPAKDATELAIQRLNAQTLQGRRAGRAGRRQCRPR